MGLSWDVARWVVPVALALAGAVLTGCGTQATTLPPSATLTLLPPPTHASTMAVTPSAGTTQERGTARVEQANRDKVQPAGPAAVRATLSVEPADGGRAAQIWVEGIAELYAVDLEIGFDASHLQVADADLGTAGVQIEPGRAPVPDFVATNRVDNRAGVIRYVATQLGSKPGFGGKGLVATITWQNAPGPDAAAAVTVGKAIMATRDSKPVDVIFKQ